MVFIYDMDGESFIGPFKEYDEATTFMNEVESTSRLNINKCEIYELDEPKEWLKDNSYNMLMETY